MKKILSMLLAVCLTLTLAACGEKQEAPAAATGEWTREGYYTDVNGNMLSVTWMDDTVDGSGWYVGFMNGDDPVEDSYGGFLQQDGLSLRGALPCMGDKGELEVTITEAGDDGLMLFAPGGEVYEFSPMELNAAPITVSINTEGLGHFNALTDGDTYETGDDYMTTSMILNLYEPAAYTLSARGDEGWEFVKWTKNGEDLSTEPDIIVEFAESADYLAVFEYPEEAD